MRIGLIGLKFSGKTTLMNAITGADLPVGQGGVDPHVAVGKVPDARLDHLATLYKPKRVVPAQVEWVDIPGFVAGAGPDGAREATRFLEHGRRMDALAQVVRCFDGGYGTVDPAGDLDTLALELMMADLQIIENRIERLDKDIQRMGKVANPLEPELMQRCRAQLEEDRPLRDLDLNRDEEKLISGFTFLTRKPMIFVFNLAESDEVPAAAIERAKAMGGAVVSVCASMEEELSQLEAEDAAEFLADLGIEEPAVALMIRAAYEALNLRSFFTVGPDECRAWNVPAGALAPQAAGVIHSDLERGFIRAETCAYTDLVEAGDMAEAKKANKVRLEGKNYEVLDGDIIEIRFNV